MDRIFSRRPSNRCILHGNLSAFPAVKVLSLGISPFRDTETGLSDIENWASFDLAGPSYNTEILEAITTRLPAIKGLSLSVSFEGAEWVRESVLSSDSVIWDWLISKIGNLSRNSCQAPETAASLSLQHPCLCLYSYGELYRSVRAIVEERVSELVQVAPALIVGAGLNPLVIWSAK